MGLISGALGTVTSLCHLAKISYDHTYEGCIQTKLELEVHAVENYLSLLARGIVSNSVSWAHLHHR